MNMKSNIKTLFLLVASACALHADPVKMTDFEANQLSQALQALDITAPTKVIDQGKDPAKVIQVPFDFSGKTRMRIAHDIVALKPAADAYHSAVQGIVKASGLTDMAKINADPKINAEAAEAGAQPITVDLDLITLDELLKGDTNQIPSSVLAALDKVIVREKK
jgi:hypothetical protein